MENKNQKPHFHHIIHPRRLHNAQDPTKKLRNEHWLIPPLEDDAHVELHKQVGIVAIPSYLLAVDILKNFEPHPGNYLKTIDRLVMAIERSVYNPKMDEIEQAIGNLMMRAIYQQRPFIEQGLIVQDEQL